MNLESKINMPLFQVSIYPFRESYKAEGGFAIGANNPSCYVWAQHARCIIGARNLKHNLFLQGVELRPTNEPIHPWQELLQLLHYSHSMWCELIAPFSPDEQIITKHGPESIEGSADSRLGKEQASRRSRNTPFFSKDSKYDKQIKVDLP